MRAMTYCGLCYLFFAALTFVFYPFEYDKDSDYVRNNKSLIGAVNRWQQAEYFENQEFQADLSEFINLYKPEVNQQLPYYDYIVKTENNLALIYSMPKEDYEDRQIFNITIEKDKNKPLYSHVGAAYVKSKNKQNNPKFEVNSVICQSNSIGYILPKKPILQEGTLSCNLDTHKIK